MNDPYGTFVDSAVGKRLAKALGLPMPVQLRRHTPGAPLLEGPALVLGGTPAAEAAARLLTSWGVEVQTSRAESVKYAAVVACFDGIDTPAAIGETVLDLGGTLRQLATNSRVVTVAEDPEAASVAEDPAARAARQGITGLTRSLAHEMRAGGTANGIQLGDGVGLDAPGAAGALRFLLSGRSAYVSGQFLPVTTTAGRLPEDPDRPLAGKVAVVTGAARGIGAAIIRTLARDGATVVGVDVPAAGESLTAVVNELGGTALPLDITAEDAGARILEHCRSRHGRMDIVVHNAGITRDKMLANMDAARWDSVLAVNTLSQLRMNEAFLADEAKDVVGEGLRIVTLASTSGIAGNRGQTNYAASKSGVMGLAAATAPLLAARGGTINAVAPGFIETEMTAKIPLLTREVGRRINSLSQGGTPVDVAEAIAFLVSDAAGGTNGNTLRVCGQAMMGA
ncbi:MULTISPECIES: 3-oxoacyl-ACP reductase [Micrococcus]|uniref:3-oxoacyl-ACP reductase n=1 Tax=Micrococcus TaxID=1269 RepID=UPI0008A41936|nr:MULTISPECIES: 3-oxoacyl-ACP reductase [Micrococcus]OFR86223.1 beta-oxoacyl-ACP reductase [Micrococcus sp. HMSC067E09]PNL18012.1 3-oxoacyl-ACP reductase [Micrococcus sp. FDAARGOS_333]WIK82895.1 3-oxoacyl-ACP reductase [Micrococcus lylae]